MSKSADSTDRLTTTRRSVLAVLATGGGAAAFAELTDADPPNPERTGLGGTSEGSAATPHRYGGLSLAPSTIPVEANDIAWARGDDQTDDAARASIPDDSTRTWTASGLGWSVAGDITTAKTNLPQQPGIAATAGPNGTADVQLVYDDASLPTTWTADGVEYVIDSSESAARSTWSGSYPAVLWAPGSAPNTTFGEVMIDG
jgi:hypothetical protein